MLLISVNKIFIHLICDNINVTLYNHVSDRTKLLLSVKHTGRVVWCVKYNSLCLVCNCLLQILCLKLVALLLCGLNNHRYTARKLNDLRIAEPEWCRDDHLITRIDQCCENIGQRMLSSIADHDLIRCIIKSIEGLKLLRNSFL